MTAQQEIDSLVRILYFPDPAFKGVMIDVGAAGPEFLSNSLSFRKRGWRVIAIEPNPHFCEAQRLAGHDVLEYACSDEDRDDVDFHVVALHGVPYKGGKVSFESLSSLGLSEEMERGYAEIAQRTKASRGVIPVKVRKLDTILAQHAPDVDAIDLISVDVEGWELPVMRGLSFEKYKPKVIVLENNLVDPAYRSFMQERGYDVGALVENNDIYVRTEWLDSLAG